MNGHALRATAENYVMLLGVVSQTLLQNNASARFFNAKLSGTEYRVEDIAGFLTKASEDKRPPGTAFTWRDVFNETDQAVHTISRFMEVSPRNETNTLHPTHTHTHSSNLPYIGNRKDDGKFDKEEVRISESAGD